MQDLIAVLGFQRLAIIGGLMLLAVAVTLFACIPTAYVSRVVTLLRRLQ